MKKKQQQQIRCISRRRVFSKLQNKQTHVHMPDDVVADSTYVLRTLKENSDDLCRSLPARYITASSGYHKRMRFVSPIYDRLI
jgi:hypothetical protein